MAVAITKAATASGSAKDLGEGEGGVGPPTSSKELLAVVVVVVVDTSLYLPQRSRQART